MVGLNAGAPDLKGRMVLAELDLFPGRRSNEAERELYERLRVGQKGFLPLADALDVYAQVLVTGKAYLPFRRNRSFDLYFDGYKGTYEAAAFGSAGDFARQLPERPIDAIDFGDAASFQGYDLSEYRNFRALVEGIATQAFSGAENPNGFRIDTLSHHLMNYREANWGKVEVEWLEAWSPRSGYLDVFHDEIFVNSDLGASIVLAMSHRWSSGLEEDA